MAISFCGKRCILTRNIIYNIPKRKNGYIILLPEIGEDLPDKDPLLKANGLPEFNTFSVERVIAAIGKLSVLFEQGIQTIEKNIEGNDDLDIIKEVIEPIEELKIPLETTWGIAKCLYFGNQSLMPKKHYFNIHARVMRVSTLRHTSKPIYEACKRTLQNEKLKLTPEQRRIVNRYKLIGHLNGLDVEKKYLNTLNYVKMKIFTKSEEMRQKVEIGSLIFKSTITNPNIVKDFPIDYLRAIASDPNNPHQGPWKINLQPDIISGFLKYCPDRELRSIAWKASVEVCAIGSEFSLQTSSNLEDVRDYRMRMAKLIGYKSYAHMSMETKLAGSLENIYQTMNDLLATARPAQEKEIEELTAFARDRGFDGDMIRQWDIEYWMRKHRRSVLNFKDEILHQYFPLPHVLENLFQLIEKLFNIKIVEGRKTDVWHTDVRFFDVIDLNGSDNEPIAHFYLDPYTRGKNKIATKSTSWTVPIRNKSTIVSTTPLVSLIFNFRPPIGDVPSLLSFNDVINLFYEVGNALQYLLTRANYSDTAGMANVEWEAVNVSGNFMKHWLYEPKIIRSIATHYKTNEPIPDEQIESIINIKSHMAGYKLCKELYYARYDLELHEKPDFWVSISKRLWEKHFVMPRYKYDSDVTSWLNIFTSDWGAAHYTSLWSKMIAADAYGAFQEFPEDNIDMQKEISMRFRDTFLALGSIVPASTIFRQYRGRDPNSRALLRHLRLKFTNDENQQ